MPRVQNPIYLSRSRVHALLCIATLLFLAVGCGSGGEDDPLGWLPVDDYSRPGSTGTIPSPGGAEFEADFSVEAPIPAPPACDVPYEILVRVREPVGSCTGYDFRPLYNRAVDLAVARIAQIQCPSGCVRFPWPIAQNWSCVDGFAVVLLNYGVMCCSPSAVLPPAAPLPPSGPILGPQTGPFNPTDHEEISQLTPGSVAPCPGSARLTFNSYEKVPDCASVGSFQPFVERAHARARFLFDQIKCAPACTKDPFAVSSTQWDCTGNLVHVRVYVVVTCR